MVRKKYVSKSLIKLHKKCKRASWYYKNQYKSKNPETIEDTELFYQGNLFGKYLQYNLTNKYGKENCATVDRKPWEYDLAMADTNSALRAGKKVIFEASFDEKDGYGFVMVDALVRNDDGTFDIIEAKKHTGSDKSIKQAKEDVYIQLKTIMENEHGLEIRNIYIARVNPSYVREESHSVYDIAKGIISFDDITTETKKYVNKGFYDTEGIMTSCGQKNAPQREYGTGCRYCSFSSTCLGKEAQEYNVLKLLGTDWRERAKYIKLQNDISLDGFMNFYKSHKVTNSLPLKLSETTKVDIESYLSKEEYIDKKKVVELLEEIRFPIYSLDYETINSVVPMFPGAMPNQQIPFQFSVHIYHEDGTLEHKEYLHKTKDDPRKAVMEKLQSFIAKDGGSIVAYNAPFEKSVNEKLAIFTGDEDAKSFSDDINSRLWDPMTIFQKRWMYNPEQKSSYSLKYVAPAWLKDTGLDYSALDVGNGAEAYIGYLNWLRGNPLMEESKFFESLEKYCEYDTLNPLKLISEISKRVDYDRTILDV